MEREEFRTPCGYSMDSNRWECWCSEGCNRPFSIEHRLSYKCEGLIRACHDDMKLKWNALCADTLDSTCVFDKPKIYAIQDVCVARSYCTTPEDIFFYKTSVNGF